MSEPLPATTSQDSSFEILEERVVRLIAVLRATRGREAAAVAQASALREAVAEKDNEIQRLRAAGGSSKRGREAIKKRIEALLLRVEKLDKAG